MKAEREGEFHRCHKCPNFESTSTPKNSVENKEFK